MHTTFLKLFRLVLPFLWKDRASRRATVATLGIIVTSAVAQNTTIWVFRYLIDHALGLPPSHLLLTVALLILSWHASIVLPKLIGIVFFYVINQATRALRLRVITHLHQVPLQAWEQHSAAEIISANSRVSQGLQNFMKASFVQIFPAIVNLVALSATLLYLHSHLAYFPLLVLLTYVYVYSSLRRFLQSRRQAWETTDQVRTAMNDSLQGTKFAQYHVATETQRLGQLFDKEAARWWRNKWQQYQIPLIQDTLFFLFAGLLVIHTLLLVRAGSLSISQFVVIKSTLWRMHSQMKRITVKMRSLLTSLIDLQKVLGFLDLPQRTATDALTKVPHAPVLELRNVSFSYAPQAAPVLQHVSLAIQPGEHIAILGPSGAGKSTLCHLLAGLYPPQEGTVQLYGTSMQQLSLTTIGQYVHLVDQEAHLITGTIAENLRTEVSRAQTLPLAYLMERMEQSISGEGKRISGGERQRILLARSLSYQSEVLILDETLSALDEESAQALLRLVLSTVPTVIFVTHRQSLVQDFQHIYRLEAGKLQPA